MATTDISFGRVRGTIEPDPSDGVRITLGRDGCSTLICLDPATARRLGESLVAAAGEAEAEAEAIRDRARRAS
jgi:hypothetical protein